MDIKSLFFLALISYFASMKQKFESICAILSETDWSAHFTLTFADVCICFDADMRAIDDLMYDTFGMSGDEIMEQCRFGPMNVNLKGLSFMDVENS